mmetsp:Transcript_14073/g.20107  ORF Transcript_14073/g.20107 Transcript_14073/m.20107 type:complete len:380 (+) Transcript_14073:121-1260(+)
MTNSMALIWMMMTWCSNNISNVNALSLMTSTRSSRIRRSLLHHTNNKQGDDDHDIHSNSESSSIRTRRAILSSISSSHLSLILASSILNPQSSVAAAASVVNNDGNRLASKTSDAIITHKITFTLRGVAANYDNDNAMDDDDNNLTIGLFGKDAPQPVSILTQLASKKGYTDAPCKPREIRNLQREQLEANRVYNACTQDTANGLGVNYESSTIWRILSNQRIDMGAVEGKFLSRLSPDFQSFHDYDTNHTDNHNNLLTHDALGVVSVRKGTDGGFGFTIYMGTANTNNNYHDPIVDDLNRNHIVVGRVMPESMKLLQRINQSPVVKSNTISINNDNYNVIINNLKSKPSRACRYGSSELYCNEYKPLKKIIVTKCVVE